MFDDKIYTAEETLSKAVVDAKEWESAKKKPVENENPRRIHLSSSVFYNSGVLG